MSDSMSQWREIAVRMRYSLDASGIGEFECWPPNAKEDAPPTGDVSVVLMPQGQVRIGVVAKGRKGRHMVVHDRLPWLANALRLLLPVAGYAREASDES